MVISQGWTWNGLTLTPGMGEPHVVLESERQPQRTAPRPPHITSVFASSIVIAHCFALRLLLVLFLLDVI